MRRAYQLTALALRNLAGVLPAALGLLIGAGAGYLLWPRLLPEASALVVLPFAVFGAVAGWLAFRIPSRNPSRMARPGSAHAENWMPSADRTG